MDQQVVQARRGEVVAQRLQRHPVVAGGEGQLRPALMPSPTSAMRAASLTSESVSATVFTLDPKILGRRGLTTGRPVRRLTTMPDDEVTEAERVRQLRELLDERRQRAEELTVLNDLARRLASLRDPAVVLSEVARQARRLLAVDVAYIMLLQPEDVLRIEVVDGSMGSALRGIELDRDIGLGGEVSGPANRCGASGTWTTPASGTADRSTLRPAASSWAASSGFR